MLAEAGRPVLERLARAAQDDAVPAGTLIREGEQADAFYVLLDGEMTVRLRGDGAVEVDLPTMTDGAWFGEIGLLQRIPRTATVTATRDSRVLRINGEDFLASLIDAPARRPCWRGPDASGANAPGSSGRLDRRLALAGRQGGELRQRGPGSLLTGLAHPVDLVELQKTDPGRCRS